MDHFSYHSEQIHSEFKNNKGQTRKNSVSIKNGRGHKSVEIFAADGKLITRKEKALNPSELGCIRRNKFIPGLFKDCIKPISPQGSARSTRKTHRRDRK
jgi:hypothetical protein